METMGDITFKCPMGFQIRGPDCYLFVDVAMNYYDAEDMCEAYGATLVKVRDEMEMKTVNMMVQADYSHWTHYWIGNVVEDEDDVCGGFWDRGQPQNTSISSRVYVAANTHNGRWAVRRKQTRFPYLCQTDACVKDTFRCRNGEKCLSNKWTCDGIYDCEDQSDESDCASKCTHYLYQSSGTLNQNTGYTAGQTCTWIIEGPPGQPLSIMFSSLTVEDDVDYVEVWSGSPSILTSRLQARLTGSLTNRKVYGYNNFLIVRLVADTSTQYVGFTANWEPDDGLSHRMRQVTATTSWMELTSPYFNSNPSPEAYVRHYTVSTDQGSVITMEVTNSDLGGGFEYDPEELSKVSGDDDFPMVFLSRSNSFTFFLVSNGCVRPEKFQARVKKGCEVHLTRANGYITSPNFDGHYPPSVTCTYMINAPAEAPRSFQFSLPEIDLADDKDSVKVFDGMNSGSTDLTPGGGFSPSTDTYTTTSHVFLVEFVSSLVQTEGSFKLMFNLACPAINNTANMMLSTMDTQYGSSVNLSCNTGFAFAQEEYHDQEQVVILCGEGGTWNASRMPTCAEIFCGVPEQIPNGFIREGSGDARYNATVTYQCFEGFTMTGTNTSTCGDGSIWSSRPVCQASQCSSQSNLTDGNHTIVTGTGTGFGTVMRYACDPGFDLIGSRFTLCQTDGSWSHDLPYCQRIKCPIPEIEMAESLNGSEPVIFGGQLTLRCEDGYVFQGTTDQVKTYDCLASGDFGISGDACVDFDECSDNSKHNCTDAAQTCTNTNGSFTCGCEAQYRWNGAQCEVINQCNDGTSGCDLVNGDCLATNSGEDYVCTCNEGYTLFTMNGVSGRDIQSQEDGQTPGDVYYINHTCVPETCGQPPNITNGRVLTEQTSFDFGDAVKYICDFGYKMITDLYSSDMLTCSSGGMWDKNASMCEPVTCEALNATGLVRNISPSGITNPGDMISLTCFNESSEQNYTKTLFCAYDKDMDTFRLQGDNPHCPAIDCGELTNLPGGVNISEPSDRGLGSSFTFACSDDYVKDGHSTSGNDTVTCETNGRWGLGNLTCSGPRCTDPGTPGGMVQTEANFEENGLVVYRCLRSGFRPNPQNRICMYTSGNASWGGSEPTCEDVTEPVFTNCPPEMIKIKLYGNPSTVIPTPNATDNSGFVKMTVSPDWFSNDVPLDKGTLTVTYTATDAAGNSATCTVNVEINDPGTLPDLACPNYLVLDVNTTVPYTVNLGNHVSSNHTLNFINGQTVTVSPATVGKTAHRVTATDTFGFQTQCAFIVEIKPNTCLQNYIDAIPPSNADIKNCAETISGTINCTVECKPGYAFQDGSTSMSYDCEGTNQWMPPLPARSCVATVEAEYVYVVDVEYSFTSFLITECQDGLRTRLQEHVPQQNLTSGGCNIIALAASMKFEVLGVEYDINKITINSLTARISLGVTSDPAVIQDVDYRICGTHFGETFYTGQLFDVSGSPVSCPGLASPSQTLTSGTQTVISRGKSCNTGYILIDVSGSEKCVQCEPGFSYNGTACVECGDGEYQDLAGQTQCKMCENGAQFTTQPRVSSNQCVASCPDGFFNNQTHTATPDQCIACPEDTHLNTPYTATCTACSVDTSTVGVEGATQQSQCSAKCSAGQYPVNNTVCADCPRGYYKSSVDNMACTPCAMDETTPSEASTSNANCEAVSDTVNCENGGNSTIDYHRGFCSCPDGYSGERCNMTADPCASTPCYNGGTCMSSSPSSYTCQCPTSQRCDMVNNPIPYNAGNTELELISSIDVETCKQRCVNNTACAALIFYDTGNCLLYEASQYSNGSNDAGSTGYIKSCATAYLFTGDQCETDETDDCTNETCSDKSFCRDLINDADCVCPSDSKYTAGRCDINLDLCSTSPCLNGATCVDSGEGVRTTCVCQPGFTGQYCENDIDECAENPDGCLYSGTCVNGTNEYTCDCGSYTGDHCETKPDFCGATSKCDNGLCYNDFNLSSAVCVCHFPYRLNAAGGCEEIDLCTENNTCENNSTCQRQGPGKISCQCETGYNGSRCQHNIDDCSSNPCMYGECMDMVNNYTCQCHPGYTGHLCETDIDDCTSHNCTSPNTERCVDMLLDYMCVCKVGYTGKYCETDINECLSLPCQHNGTCAESSEPGNYTCDCVDAWTGHDCESLVDYCDPSPCNNSGSCHTLQDNFFCDCADGTFGETCEEASKLCEILDPCTSDSSCVDSDGTATCDCPANYTGTSCNMIANGCNDMPCQNGACIIHPIGYACKCEEGYSGDDCSIEANPCDSANCPSGSTCLVEDGKALCLCGANQLKSGSTCKDTSNDFDIYFTREGPAIRSYQPFRLTKSSLSISVWIAPLENTDVAPVELRLSNNETLLALKFDSVTFRNGNPVKMIAETGNKVLELKEWNQVTLTWSNSGTYSIFHDGIDLGENSTTADFPPLNEPIYIYIGDSFTGYISQLSVWESVLTYQDSLEMYDNPKSPSKSGDLVAHWSGYRLFDNLWSRLVSPSIVVAALKVCHDGKNGSACDGSEVDKEPPTISGCPNNLEFSVERLKQISGNVPSFSDGNKTLNLNDTLLTFGAHRVVYMGQDDQDNVAFCRFQVYVQREGMSCNDTKGLNPNNIVSCETQGQKVECAANNRPLLSPNILTCGKIGSYNLDVPYQLPPAVICGDTAAIKYKVTVTIVYILATNCGEPAEDDVRDNLLEKVKDLQGNWPTLCPDSSCNNAVITAKCQGSNSKMIDATIVLKALPATLSHTTTGVMLTAKELLQTASLELDSFDIPNVYGAQPQNDSVMIMAEPNCEAGFGLDRDVCVECAAGSFLNETTGMCELCPIGSYTDTDRETTCTSCPDGQTTIQLGASMCKPKCDPGSFLDSSDQCQLCVKNFYQPLIGQVNCLPCRPGTATETNGTVSDSECIDTCPAGTELKNSSCVSCPRGFYRDGINQEVCVECPSGMTTSGMGTTSMDLCNQAACDPGSFRNDTEDICEVCDYGYYQPEKWQDECIKCNDSYTTLYTNSTSADDCLYVCEAGDENLSGTSCTECKRGYYRTNALADRFENCSSCNETFTTPGEGYKMASDCNIRICNPGYYRNINDNMCYECPYGQYQPDSLQDECMNCTGNTTTKQMGSVNSSQCVFYCEAGYEVLSPENQTCQACDRGFFKINDGEAKFNSCQPCSNSSKTTDFMASVSESFCNISKCEAGQIIGTNGECVNCMIDEFQNDTMPNSLTTCQMCPTGTGTKNPKQTLQTDCKPVCDPGQQYNSSSSSCEPCPMGTWNSGDNMQRFEQCTKCQDGYVTDNETTGAISNASCTLRDCPVGQFIDGTDCTPCAVGYYQDVPRQTVCKKCRANTNTSGEGQDEETDCTISCPAGETQVLTTNETCVPCEADTIKPEQGPGSCTQCTGNSTSNDARIACSELFCDKGFKNNSQSNTCEACEKGTYKMSRGNDYQCEICPTNTTTAGMASTSMNECDVANCDVGFYSPNDTLPCLACPLGRYKNFTGNADCEPCPGGFTTELMGNIDDGGCTVVVCPTGQYRNAGNQCVNCSIGSYQDETGQTSCTNCSSGYTTLAAGSTTSNACRIVCPAGQYRNDTTNMCVNCSVGQYQENSGQTSCNDCTSGYTTSQERSTSSTDCFIVCPIGQYRVSNSLCMNCSIGTYQNEMGQTACKNCSGGYTTLFTGSTLSDECRIDCPAGQFRNDTTNSCMNCPVGQYQENSGQISCNDCPSDYTTNHSNSTSSTDCFIVCAVGSYSTSRTDCAVCPQGQYQSASGSNQCDPCPAGNTTLQTESTSIDDCQPICSEGYYLNTSLKMCIRCALGYYNPLAGNITFAVMNCDPCPDGKTTVSNGSASASDCSIDDCLPGFSRSNSMGCAKCPLGQYQPQKSQVSCEMCVSGLTTLKTGRISNESCVDDCPSGTEYNIKEGICKKCSIGYYRLASDNVDCVKCALGKTTLQEGESACIDSAAVPRPITKRNIRVKIMLRLDVCINKDQLGNVIINFINGVIRRLDIRFPALCVDSCTNLAITFRTGCLQTFTRSKRQVAQDQEVELVLSEIDNELRDNDTGQFYQSATVISQAFYDIQPEKPTLDDNKITFLGVSNVTSDAQCQPGQYNDGSDCLECAAGSVSTDGLGCTPCGLNTYQNVTGQSSCVACPAKMYTASTGATNISFCTKKCDEPDARATYCSGRGACVYDPSSSNGVTCQCDDNYGGGACSMRQEASDDKTKMIGAIVGGAAAFLLLLLVIFGVIACLRRAGQKAKKTGYKDTKSLKMDDGMSEQYPDYNYPMYDNGAVRGLAGRPALMYINPVADEEVRDFYSPDRSHSNPPSRYSL